MSENIISSRTISVNQANETSTITSTPKEENEMKSTVNFEGIELAIAGALESVDALVNEVSAAELVIALQKAAQKLAKEKDVGSNELKATRACKEDNENAAC